MITTKGLASLAAATLLFCSPSLAAPQLFHKAPHLDTRDNVTSGDSTGSTSSGDTGQNASSNILEPIVPPNVNPTDLSILNLDSNVTLAWAGTAGAANATSRKLRKRDGAVFSTADFEFLYPVVPLDHSTFVSSVACPSNNTLTARLSSSAYTYAKKLWSTVPDLVFVTAADGCGQDLADDFFHATSVTFSDADMSFTANGNSSLIYMVAGHMSLTWGNIGTHNVVRSTDKSVMFEPHPLDKRGRADFIFHWGAWLHSDDYLGTDHEAPWPFAAKLASWGREGGEEDDSYKKGEVASADGHHKRWNNDTSLATLSERELEERELTFGLRLYCVECGFGGVADVYGIVEVDFDWLPPFFSLSKVQCGIELSMKAGLNIGMWAFVKYEKEWEKELGRVYLEDYGIPGICDIGPFISVSVKATAGIEASGQLLVGASAIWDGVDMMLDVLHPSNSHSTSLSPQFIHNTSASGEVKVEAKLGLPIMLGVGVRLIGGLWKAEAGIVDTPSIVAEGKFEVSAEVNDEGEIETDINDGCYGIAWNVHFENELDAVMKITGIDIKPVPLVRPQESEPIAEGCIGYVKDGTDDDDEDNPQGTGTSTGTTGNGLSSGGNGLSGGSPGNAGGSKSTTTSSALKVVNAAQVQSSTSSSSSSSTSSSSSASSSSTTAAVVKAQSATSSSGTSTSTSTSSTSTTKSSTTLTTASTSKVAASSSAAAKTGSSSSSSVAAQVQSTTSKTRTATTSSSTSTSSKATTSTTSSAATQTTTSKTTTSSSSSSSTSKPNTSSTSSSSTTTVKAASTSSSTATTSTTTLKTTTTSSSSTSSKPTTTATTTSSATTSSSTSAKTSTTTSSSTSTKVACTPSTTVTPVTVTATSTSTTTSISTATITCSKTVTQASVPTGVYQGTATTVNTQDLCAGNCFKDTKCLSFSYSGTNTTSGSCQLYNKAYKDLGVTVKNGMPTLTFFDHDCYAYNTCPK